MVTIVLPCVGAYSLLDFENLSFPGAKIKGIKGTEIADEMLLIKVKFPFSKRINFS